MPFAVSCIAMESTVHLLGHELFVATIPKDAVSDITHSLLRLLLKLFNGGTRRLASSQQLLHTLSSWSVRTTSEARSFQLIYDGLAIDDGVVFLSGAISSAFRTRALTTVLFWTKNYCKVSGSSYKLYFHYMVNCFIL